MTELKTSEFDYFLLRLLTYFEVKINICFMQANNIFFEFCAILNFYQKRVNSENC